METKLCHTIGKLKYLICQKKIDCYIDHRCFLDFNGADENAKVNKHRQQRGCGHLSAPNCRAVLFLFTSAKTRD